MDNCGLPEATKEDSLETETLSCCRVGTEDQQRLAGGGKGCLPSAHPEAWLEEDGEIWRRGKGLVRQGRGCVLKQALPVVAMPRERMK